MKRKLLQIAIALLATPALTNAQWVAQPSDLSPNRYAQFIDAVDSNVVWALAADPANQSTPVQEFTKTVDGGNLWIANPITNAAGLSPSGICAINADTAWVAMYNGTAGGGRILRTTDGGISWTWQSTAAFAAPLGFPNWVHFFDGNNGVCMGDPNNGYFEIYTTVDGGSNWVRVPQANIPANQAGEYGVTSVFTAYGDSLLWFGTNQGRIFRSDDRGLQWTVASTPYAGSFIGDLTFRDELNGIASNGTATSTDIIRTDDGGLTWNAVATNTVGIAYKLLSAVPGADSTYFLSSPTVGGGTAFSLNDGDSWVSVDNLIHSDVEFVNATTGWTGSNELNAPMFKWSGVIQTNCLSLLGPLEFASPDSICTVDSVVYSVRIDRTNDQNMRVGFNAVFYDENYLQIGAQSISDLIAAGFPSQFVPDPGQTDIGTFYFTVFFTLAPTSEIVHFGLQVFPTQCQDDTSNNIINSVFQNITTCAQVNTGIPGALSLDLSGCPQTGQVTYLISHSYNGFPPLPGGVFNCGGLSGQVVVTFYVDNGVCIKTVTDTIFCTTSVGELDESAISVYPNPVRDALTVSYGSELLISAVEIMDVSGRVVSSQRLTDKASGTYSFSVGDLSEGTYFICIITEDGFRYTRKVIRD